MINYAFYEPIAHKDSIEFLDGFSPVGEKVDSGIKMRATGCICLRHALPSDVLELVFAAPNANGVLYLTNMNNHKIMFKLFHGKQTLRIPLIDFALSSSNEECTLTACLVSMDTAGYCLDIYECRLLSGADTPVLLLEGFYPQERDEKRDFRWMKAKARLLVTDDVKTVALEYIFIGTTTTTATVRGKNGTLKFPISQGAGTLFIDVERIGGGGLYISVPYNVAPSDPRDLSLKIIAVYDFTGQEAVAEMPETKETLLERIRESLKTYATMCSLNQAGVRYYMSHLVRYGESLDYLRKTGLALGSCCLETGGGGFVTSLLRSFFPGTNILSYGGDLRKQLPFEDESLDSIVCMEVFEHLCDPVGYYESRLEGVFFALKEMHRILKPNGILFITTPNICSFRSIKALTSMRSPLLCAVHYREFTPFELRDVLSTLFAVKGLETYNVFGQLEKEPWMHAMDGTLRGDDIFVLCTKKNIVYDDDMCHLAMCEAIYPLATNPEMMRDIISTQLTFEEKL